MDAAEARRPAGRWLKAQRRLLWRQAVREPLEPQLPLPGTYVGGLCLEARLGTGGQGTVYRARSPGGRLYAVKFIHLPRAAGWAWRELEVLLRLRRIGWVAVRGHGEWPERAPRFVYLVMEYVGGWPLPTWARRRNPTARQVAELVRALARQLTAVHRAGVVHRDVKGANVVVREKDGRPVLVDFGVGTFPGAHQVTGPGVPGTAAYRSPEAEGFRRRGPEGEPYAAHARDDAWALGVLLYWLLTGGFPFEVEETGDSHVDARALGEAILHQEPEPPEVRNARVPPALGAVCRRMLEKAPEARYPDTGAVETALTAALAEADAAWDVPLCAAYGPDTTTTQAEGELDDEVEEARWRRLEAYERRHPVRGEPPSTPEEPATLAPPTGEAPASVDSPPPARAGRGARAGWGVGVGLALVLAVAALGLARSAGPGSAPGAPEATVAVVSAPPTPEVMSGFGQEVAPEGKRPEGDGGAVPGRVATPAPVARATPSQDTRVKTPAKAPVSQHPMPRPKQTGSPVGRGALMLGCTLLAGCPGPATLPQVRRTPPPAECPAGWQETHERLRIGSGRVVLQGEEFEAGNTAPLPEGPIRVVTDKVGRLPEGTLLSGTWQLGEGRIYGTFTQAQLPGGGAYPVCLVIGTPIPAAMPSGPDCPVGLGFCPAPESRPGSVKIFTVFKVFAEGRF
ncbi:protein kinase [Archangium gephyra]|uniref:serine/threonine-protein kinase n=1 Tax=Archangium gephyra TaxID=48 RepID=UPI0035D3EDFE